jgi:hypothetical protein
MGSWVKPIYIVEAEKHAGVAHRACSRISATVSLRNPLGHELLQVPEIAIPDAKLLQMDNRVVEILRA